MRILFFFFLFFLSKLGNAQTFTLTSATGNKYNDAWKCTAIDKEGNTYLAGNFSDSVRILDSLIVMKYDFPYLQLFVVKLDKNNKIVWIKKERNGLTSDVNSIGIDNNGDVLVACYGYNNTNFADTLPPIFPKEGLNIKKISKDGVFIKQQFFESRIFETATYIINNCMAFDSKNNLFLAGGFYGKMSTTNDSINFLNLQSVGVYNPYYAKLDSNLNIKWLKKLYSPDTVSAESYAHGIILDKDENIIMVGRTRDTLYLDPFKTSYLVNKELQLPGSRFNDNAWILKLNSNGDHIWSKMFQSKGEGGFHGVDIDRYDDILVSGQGSDFNGYFESDTGRVYGRQIGITFNKFASNGNPIWLSSTDWINSIVGYGIGNKIISDSAGNFYVSGSFNGQLDFDPGAGLKLVWATNGQNALFLTDHFVAKYSKNKQLLWFSRTTGSAFDPGEARNISYNPLDNNITICGSYNGTLNFNGSFSPTYPAYDPSGSNAKLDGYFAKISNNCLSRTQIKDTICAGSTKAFDGETLTKPGKYIRLKSYNPSTQCEVWEELFLHIRPELNASAGKDSSLCAGSRIRLGSDSVAMLTYNWQQIGGSFTSTKARPEINIENNSDTLQHIRYAYLASQTGTGCQKRDTVSFSIKPNRTLSQSIRLCKGESLTVGNRNYTTAGIYKDTVTALNGCDSLITSTLNFDIPNDTVQVIGQIFIAATSQDSYQWLDCNQSFGPISGATNSTFEPTTNGSYAVRVTLENCSDTSNCILFTGNLDLLSKTGKLLIQPNPSSGKATLTWEGGKTGTKILIQTIEGKTLSTIHLDSNKRAILPNLPSGVYFIKVFQSSLTAERWMVE